MESFELSSDTFDISELKRSERRKPLQSDDDFSPALAEIETPRKPLTATDDYITPADTSAEEDLSTAQIKKPRRKRTVKTEQPAAPPRVATEAAKPERPTPQPEPAIAAAAYAQSAAAQPDSPQAPAIKLPKVNLWKMITDSRVAIFVGVVFLLAAAYMLLACISYISESATDQSVLVNSSLEMIKNRGAKVENTTGWFGAMLSHFLIYKWLGLGSFVLIFYVGTLGLGLVKLCKFNFWKLTFNCLITGIAVSMIAGLLTFRSSSPTFWGGEHGYYMNAALIDNASLWSAVAVSIALLTAVILIFLNPLAKFFSVAGKAIATIKKNLALRHDAAIEAAHRTEMRRQAEQAAELARVEEQKAAPIKKEPIPQKSVEQNSVEQAAPTTPEPLSKPAPLDEIYTPLKPLVSGLSTPKAETEQETASITTISIAPAEPETTEAAEIKVAHTEAVELEDIEDSIHSSESPAEDNIHASEEHGDDTPKSEEARPLALALSVDSPSSISLDAEPQPGPSIPLEIKATQPIEKATDVDSEKLEENTETEKPELTPDTNYDPRADLSHYRFPELELLRPFSEESTVDEIEQEDNKLRIINILRSYGVEISSISATIGPSITLYEIVPAPGVRISTIKRLGDDVAMSLAALGIRIIAPIPGKGTIGMEVPNKKSRIVSMRSILSSKAYRESKAELPMALGTTISNEVYVTDLAKMPHLLVAGATGMGKSVGLNTIIASLLYRKHPAELKFVLVDPKRVEFSLYKCIEKHYLAKMPEEENAIITESENVVATLNSLCTEMELRYDLLSKAGVRGLKEYNEKFVSRRLNPNDGHRFLPYIVVVIDEFADLILTVGREVETPISRLAAKARAIGIHVILATQRPSVNVITGVIKANFPGRMAFRVTQRNDSQTILDRPGAEQLIGRGDMLISLNGIIDRVQCAFIDTPEVDEICKHIASQQAYPNAYELPDQNMGAGGAVTGNAITDRDPLFAEAGREVIGQGMGSTSSLQRKFNIGYPRAGKIMDQLEMAGVVGPTVGAKPRAVLMDLYSFERYLES
ncbi:MAG: DNA translocase FtsK [Firmicutes bacterium]|nr:DNA translocase FtsK [Bacillota bacterium]MCM1401550.1 DNA translocase FtsK [Bacteroides sp.]MCM1476596.1 DNA translocase FtsK [Bacteroides sp.]